MSFNSVNYKKFRNDLIKLIDSTVPNFILAEVKWEALKEKYMKTKFVNSRDEYQITRELFEGFYNPHMEFVKTEQVVNFYPIYLFAGDADVFFSKANELGEGNYIINKKLISIDGQNVDKIRKMIESKYSRFGKGVKNKQLIKKIKDIIKKSNHIDCVINYNNKNESLVLTPIKISKPKKEKLNSMKIPEFILTDHIHYIYFKPSSFQMKKCSDLYFTNLCKYERDVLVLDLRYNGGGLIKEAKKFVGFFLEDTTRIGYKLIKENYTDIVEPVVIYSESNKLKFETIYILTNRYTMSSSEFIVIEGLKKSKKNVIVVGEETAGLYSEADRHKCTDGSTFQVLSAVIIDEAGNPIYKGVEPDIPIVFDFINPTSVIETTRYLDAVDKRRNYDNSKN